MNNAKGGHVYILTNKPHGTLYIGVTSRLVGRVFHHKNDLVDGFSKKYRTHMLVWYAEYGDIESAIFREKQMKKWNRAWKVRVIEEMNPGWQDL